MKNAFLNFCNAGIDGYFKDLTDRPYILDKSRSWGSKFNLLTNLGRDPKIICMLRDPRDVYTSMEKKYRANPERDLGLANWAKLEGTTVRKRVDIWCSGPPIGSAMETVRSMVEENIAHKVLFIKYENLVVNPQDEINRVYDYLNIDRFVHDFDHVEQVTKEDDTIYGIFGDHIIRNKVEPLESRYREILGEETSMSIVHRHKWFYDYFDYKI